MKILLFVIWLKNIILCAGLLFMTVCGTKSGYSISDFKETFPDAEYIGAAYLNNGWHCLSVKIDGERRWFHVKPAICAFPWENGILETKEVFFDEE